MCCVSWEENRREPVVRNAETAPLTHQTSSCPAFLRRFCAAHNPTSAAAAPGSGQVPDVVAYNLFEGPDVKLVC